MRLGGVGAEEEKEEKTVDFFFKFVFKLRSKTAISYFPSWPFLLFLLLLL